MIGRLLVAAAAAIFTLMSPTAVNSTSAESTVEPRFETNATNALEIEGPADCMRFTNEPWASDVEYLCGILHDGAYDFYYKLTSGKFMRNCYCSKLKTGTSGGPLQIKHYTQQKNDASTCHSNSNKDNFAKVYMLFDTVEKCPDPTPVWNH